MDYHENILSLIGNTPLVRLHHENPNISCLLLAKMECGNPGHSVKDRIALHIVEEAEKKGLLKAGGMIIEATSGNTGFGLALVASIKGYRCLFTISDKQSKEKIDMLSALGVEVVICPSDVPCDDARSYLSCAKRLAKKYPQAFFPFQYDNLSNRDAHYRYTGPEIWSQTDQNITHYVAGIGTGGTISGAGHYLKEKNPHIEVIGVEPEGSLFEDYKISGVAKPEEVRPHYTEGIGSDFVPKNVDIDLIDKVLAVSDGHAAGMARHLAKEHGLFVGWSSGAAVCAAMRYAEGYRGAPPLKKEDVMVVIMPDHGNRYLKKIYNDAWMKEKGYEDITRADNPMYKSASK